MRIGLLVDGYSQPAWIRAALERMLAGGAARIVAVAVNEGDNAGDGGDGKGAKTPSAPVSRLARWITNRDRLLLGAYRRLDRWKFPVHESPFTAADISDLVAGATVVPVRPRRTKFSDYFDTPALEALAACDLDVAVRLGFRILRGDALRVARFGVWSYHHGDNETKRGGPSGFWEVLEREETTGAMLQVLGEELDGGTVLMRGWVRTDRFSPARNAAQLYWMAEPFLARAVALLAGGGPEALGLTCTAGPALSVYSERLYTAPRNAELLAPLVRLGARYAAGHLRDASSRAQWTVAVWRGRMPEASDGMPEVAPFRYKVLEPPDGWSWADPFPARVGGRDFLFFEEFQLPNHKGRIAVIEFGEDGKAGKREPVLDLPYHLSYPFHFSHEGEEYLMPECGTRKAVEIWRARRFPHDWTLEHSMLEGEPWVDATLERIGDQWVLFAALDTGGRGAWDELHVFFSDTPFGPWRPHRRNPVVVDVRSARPGGRLIRLGDRLIRPAQDGTRRYGYALRFQEIVRLDERDYEERTVTRLLPRWAPALVATHTFNHVPGFAAIDAQRIVRR